MLCSVSDIEALRQIDITDDNDPTILALISHAEGIIEGATGRSFEAVTDVEVAVSTLNQTDGLIWLEVYPLTAVAVNNADDVPYTLDTHYTWNALGQIRRLGVAGGSFGWQYEGWRTPEWPRGTTITYSGGVTDPDDVPRDLRGVCAEIAADLFDRGSASGPAGVIQESLGGWSATYQRLAGNLTDQQKRILRRYTRDRGSLVTV